MKGLIIRQAAKSFVQVAKIYCFTFALIFLVIFTPDFTNAQLFGSKTEVQEGGLAIGGDVSNSSIHIGDVVGISDETLKILVQNLASHDPVMQAEALALLRARVPEGAAIHVDVVTRMLRLLGESELPEDELVPRFEQLARDHIEMLQRLEALEPSDPETSALVEAARKAVEEGRLEEAETKLLAAEEAELLAAKRAKALAAEAQEAANARLSTAAAARAERGELAWQRLDYHLAGDHFKEAASVAVAPAEQARYQMRWADALTQQARYGEAGPLFRRALEVQEELLGREHLETLKSVASLSILFRKMGRYGEAEPLLRRALATHERLSGPEHPETLRSYVGLANLYRETGRYGEAEPLLRRALTTHEWVSGQEHPETLRSLNSLADLYQFTGRYGDAEPLLRRALEARERVFGPEHPETLASITSLARLYLETGRELEAEPLFARSLVTRERVLGSEHPETINSLYELAAVYQSQQRYIDAEPMLIRAIASGERVLGTDHPDTLTAMDKLAEIYHESGRYADAEPLFVYALEGFQRVLGQEHPKTLRSANNLANLFLDTGRFSQAEALFARSIQGRERVLGPEHPDTVESLGDLSILLVRSDRQNEALRVLQRIDFRLRMWLEAELVTIRSAAQRRRTLMLHNKYINMGHTLALQHSTDAAVEFAANLAINWKKRILVDDQMLNHIADELSSPESSEAVLKVQDGRRALSNIAFDPAVSSEEKARLRDKLEVAETELRDRSAAYTRFISIGNIDVEEIQFSLRASETLVEYRLYEPFDFENGNFGETRLLAILVQAHSNPVMLDLGLAEALFRLETLVLEVQHGLASEASLEDLLELGYQILIDPIKFFIDDTDTLYFSLDGPLHSLPINALRDIHGVSLIEELQVNILQTSRSLVGGSVAVSTGGLVAVGGVEYGEHPENADGTIPAPITRQVVAGFQNLQETRGEIEYISSAYSAFRPEEPAPIILTGSEATEAAVKAIGSPPRVLHFATHGYYLESSSIVGRPLLQSGIPLAGANRALRGETGDDGENGILHALEAQDLNLLGTELVVLSACDTAQGNYDYFEGPEGLPRAFYLAGAQNVMASLWPVSDRETRNFMSRFYDNWLSQVESDPAKALRETQLWYINNLDKFPAGYINWATFVLFEG